MPNCLHCQTTIPEGAKFCLECGKPVAEASNSPHVCSTCGQTLSRPVNFCTFCGSRQTGAEEQPEVSPHETTARLEIQTPVSELGYPQRVDTGKLGQDAGRVTRRMQIPTETGGARPTETSQESLARGSTSVPETELLSAGPPSVPPTQPVSMSRNQQTASKNATLIAFVLLAVFILGGGATASYFVYWQNRAASVTLSNQPQPAPGEPGTAAPSPPQAPQSPPEKSAESPTETTPPAPQPPSRTDNKLEVQQERQRSEPEPSAHQKTEDQQRVEEQLRAAERLKAEEERRRLQKLRDAEERDRQELATIPRSGNFHWRGNVDGMDEIIVRRDNALVRHVEAQPITESSFSFSSPLPPVPTKVELVAKRGRGKAHLVQAPAQANDYTMIIRVEDPKRGREWLEFTVRWEVIGR